MTNALYLKYRNTLAGLYAMLLIISGATARARKRVFKEGLFTSLCFHNPNRRVFESCIRWLKKKGYVFISSDELLEILEGRKEAPAGAVWISLDDGNLAGQTPTIGLVNVIFSHKRDQVTEEYPVVRCDTSYGSAPVK